MNSLGEKLRNAREAANISIDDAVYLGGIPRDVLKAMEEDNFGYFSSPLYARSFFKQYGEYVGVDPGDSLDNLVPVTMIDGEAVESFIDLSQPISTVPSRPKRRNTSEKRAVIPNAGGGMAAVWLILVTGGLLWGGMKLYQSFEKPLADAENATETLKIPSSELEKAEDESLVQIQDAADRENEEAVRISAPEAPRRAIVVQED